MVSFRSVEGPVVVFDVGCSWMALESLVAVPKLRVGPVAVGGWEGHLLWCSSFSSGCQRL